MKTTHLEPDICPACGYSLDAASGFDNASPNQGDMTVCINCAFILVFDERLKVRKATREDLDTLDADAYTKLCLVLQEVNKHMQRIS